MVIVVSACLLGRACRYDGKSGYNPEVALLCRRNDIHPLVVCPEILGGLPVPRLPAEIRGGSAAEVWSGRAQVVTSDGRDVTDAFIRGACLTMDQAAKAGAVAAIMKTRSPSCGKSYVYDGTFRGVLRPGPGIAADYLERHGLKVFGEDQLTALNKFLSA